MDSHDDGPPIGGDYDDGLIHLEDMSFDFEAFFVRFRAKELTEEEGEEFHARLMGLYCRCIFEEKRPPDWVLNYIAGEFYKILAGGAWNDSFPLPWHPRDPIHTRAEEQALQIYCDIANRIHANPELKVTATIAQVAAQHNVSLETARAAWYEQKKRMKAQGAQENYLKIVSKN